jgi:hypothetical protein
VQDSTPPVFDSCANQSFDTDVDQCSAVVGYQVEVSDDMDTDVELQCSPANNTEFALGTTLVSCNATDDFGNRGTLTFAQSPDYAYELTSGAGVFFLL